MRYFPPSLSGVFVSFVLFSLVTDVSLCGFAFGAAPSAGQNSPPEGFQSLFNGQSLDGWDGDPKFWSVEDGCLTGRSTPENKVAHNSFLILRKIAAPKNFELIVDYKMSKDANSGISFHAPETPGKPWNILGHHADIFDHPRHFGTLYYRGVQAWRGQSVRIQKNNPPEIVDQFANESELLKSVDWYGWNTFHLIVKDRTYTILINGVKMSQAEEADDLPLQEGPLGFQMHQGPVMTIRFKNVYYKSLD